MPRNFSSKFTAEVLIASFAAFLFSGCAAKMPSEQAHAPWNTFLFNEQRTNVSPERLRLPFVLSWAKDLSTIRFLKPYPEEQLSTPALSKGVLYVGSTNKSFYSYDLYKGKFLWRFDARNPLEASPAVTENLVCFGSAGGVLRCLDKKDGHEKWRFQAKSEITSAPVAKGDRIYFSSSDDRFYALSLSTGEKIWSYYRSAFQTVTPRMTASPAYSDDKIYNLFSDGVIVCLAADSGKELWNKKVVKNFDSPQKTRRTPLVHDGTVFVIDDNNDIIALSGETGDVKGTYNIIKAYDFIVIDRRTLIIAGADQVVALDTVTGSILWKKELKYRPSSVFAADDFLFVLSNYGSAPFNIGFLMKTMGHIQALRLKDGVEAWAAKLDYSVTSNASTSEDHIALLTNEGALEVFSVK